MKAIITYTLIFLSTVPLVSFLDNDRLRKEVLFYASFDNGVSADIAVGDNKLYTAETRKNLEDAKVGLLNPDVVLAKGAGLSGGALNFKNKSKRVTFFKAAKNMGYSKVDWSGAISFWLQLDPAKDLEPGYCDPIQVTDVNYNDAALWVDFTKENPRDFRLGVLGDLEVWNPKKLGPDENPDYTRRLVWTKKPPFKRGQWTHIVMNFSGLNTKSGRAELFVNGISMGKTPEISDPFSWNEAEANLLLGLNYIGLFDELAVFKRPLTDKEIQVIYAAKNGLKTILAP